MTRTLTIALLLSTAALLSHAGIVPKLSGPVVVAAEPQASIRTTDEVILAYRIEQAEKAIVELRTETRAGQREIETDHRRLLWLLVSNLAAVTTAVVIQVWKRARPA